MKNKLTKFLLAVSTLAFTIGASASDRWDTLRAINWVENPTNQTHVGRYGELGPYQFRPATWQMHTDLPFRFAADRAAADEVAVRHYEWIKHTFERAGVEPSAFNIAMAWNCGVDAVVNGRIPAASYDYAERVTNLVNTLKQRSEPLAAEQKSPPAPALDLKIDDQRTDLRFRVIQDAPHFVLAAG
jgi:hypothetical protein